MSSPDRILDVYDAPRHLGGRLLGEIREQWLTLYAFTIDGREVGSFARVIDAATAIAQASQLPSVKKRRATV